MFTKLKPLIYLALLGLAISLLSLFIWISNKKAHDNLYFGYVQSLQSKVFIVEDKFNGKTEIVFSSSTVFLKGSSLVTKDNLAQGVFVQILGEKRNGKVDARSIRFMRSPKERLNATTTVNMMPN